MILRLSQWESLIKVFIDDVAFSYISNKSELRVYLCPIVPTYPLIVDEKYMNIVVKNLFTIIHERFEIRRTFLILYMYIY